MKIIDYIRIWALKRVITKCNEEIEKEQSKLDAIHPFANRNSMINKSIITMANVSINKYKWLISDTESKIKDIREGRL